jgi:hypothetical protein
MHAAGKCLGVGWICQVEIAEVYSGNVTGLGGGNGQGENGSSRESAEHDGFLWRLG